MFDDIECELLYMYVREQQPQHMIEFSPASGWSTAHILDAMARNRSGVCTLYDVRDLCTNTLTECFADLNNWCFHQGDVETYYDSWDYDSIDMMLIDCDHGAPFANKYVDQVLPKLMQQNVTVFIHDIYHTWECGEQQVVKQYVEQHNINWFSPSKLMPYREQLDQIRSKHLGDVADHAIHSDMNPVIILNP